MSFLKFLNEFEIEGEKVTPPYKVYAFDFIETGEISEYNSVVYVKASNETEALNKIKDYKLKNHYMTGNSKLLEDPTYISLYDELEKETQQIFEGDFLEFDPEPY